MKNQCAKIAAILTATGMLLSGCAGSSQTEVPLSVTGGTGFPVPDNGPTPTAAPTFANDLYVDPDGVEVYCYHDFEKFVRESSPEDGAADWGELEPEYVVQTWTQFLGFWDMTGEELCEHVQDPAWVEWWNTPQW